MKLHETITTTPEVQRWSWMRWPRPAPPPGPSRHPPACRRMGSVSAGRCGDTAAWPAWGAACTGTLQSVGMSENQYLRLSFCVWIYSEYIQKRKNAAWDKLWTSVPTIDMIISLYTFYFRNNLIKILCSEQSPHYVSTMILCSDLPTCHRYHRLSGPVHPVEVGCDCESHEECCTLRQHLQGTWGVTMNLIALDNSPHKCIGE